MSKKVLSMILSLVLIATQFAAIPVTAAQIETTTTSDEYYTDRFILETTTDNTSMFGMRETTVSEDDIAAAVSDVLSELGNSTAEEDIEVSAITDNDSAIVLPDEVNAAEFMQAVEDTLGDSVTVHPDYPVYFGYDEELYAQYVNTTTDETTEEDIDIWVENLAPAQEISTGKGRRLLCAIGTHCNIINTLKKAWKMRI